MSRPPSSSSSSSSAVPAARPEDDEPFPVRLNPLSEVQCIRPSELHALLAAWDVIGASMAEDEAVQKAFSRDYTRARSQSRVERRRLHQTLVEIGQLESLLLDVAAGRDRVHLAELPRARLHKVRDAHERLLGMRVRAVERCDDGKRRVVPEEGCWWRGQVAAVDGYDSGAETQSDDVDGSRDTHVTDSPAPSPLQP